MSEFDCPICQRQLADPSSLPCKHSFCLTCLTTALDSSLQCPLCRKEVKETFDPKINRKLQAAILDKGAQRNLQRTSKKCKRD